MCGGGGGGGEGVSRTCNSIHLREWSHMEAESAVKQIPGLGARSHGVRFLATTPTRGDAILMVPPLLPPSLSCKRAISGRPAAHLLRWQPKTR